VTTEVAQGAETRRALRAGPALAGYRAALRRYLDDLDDAWDDAIAATDSERLHDLRVAIRRSRSVLGESSRVVPGEVRRALRTELAWLAAGTGSARDLDVLVEGWDARVAPLQERDRVALAPVRERLVACRTGAHDDVATLLRSARAEEARDRLRAWLAVDDGWVAGGPGADEPLGRIAAERLRAARRRVRAGARELTAASPPEAFHQVRKDAKRLRYLLESFGPLGGVDRSRQLVRHLRRLQDVLGAAQDAQVQSGRIWRVIDGLDAEEALPTETSAAAARLLAHLEERDTAARAAFADRFAAYDRDEVRRAGRELEQRLRR
jgi:CHAD domain-containing protein